MKYYWKLWLGAGCLSVICIAIEIAAVEELQDSSVKYILNIQESRSDTLDMFFIVISKGSMYIASLIGFTLLSGQYYKIGSQCIFITYFSLWFGNIMKNLILHPRPYWVDSEIYPLSCPKDHGSPSGHAITVGSTILFFHFHYFKTNKLVSTIISSILLALLGLDRNYLGVHFYFQVVLGFAFSFNIVSVLKSEEFWKNIEKCFKNLKLLILFQGIVFCLNFFGIFIGVFRNIEIKEKWVINYEKNCKGDFSARGSLMDPATEGTAICILAGIAQGIYLKKDWDVGVWKLRVGGVFIFAIGLVVEQVCETYIKKLEIPAKLALLSVIRYLTGFYISFLIPTLLSYCTRHLKIKTNN